MSIQGNMRYMVECSNMKPKQKSKAKMKWQSQEEINPNHPQILQIDKKYFAEKFAKIKTDP